MQNRCLSPLRFEATEVTFPHTVSDRRRQAAVMGCRDNENECSSIPDVIASCPSSFGNGAKLRRTGKFIEWPEPGSTWKSGMRKARNVAYLAVLPLQFLVFLYSGRQAI